MLSTYGATLMIPHFTRRKLQMSTKEVQKSQKISNVRIHVERVISGLKNPTTKSHSLDTA